MKGIIMAGGAGSRLRPLTCDLPKPMVPIMNRPVMHYSINLFRKYGIKDIGVTLQYLPRVIQDYFNEGSQYDVNLHYFIEETPLGTAGSVKNAHKFLDETFIVLSGDALTNVDLKKAVDFHRDRGAMATLILVRVEVPLEYGVVVTNQDGTISRFLEKPGWGEVFSDTVNTGIYILEPEVLDYFDTGVKFDFSKDLFPMLLNEKKPMYGFVTEDYWCDIGDIGSYLKSHHDLLDGSAGISIDAMKTKDDLWIEEGVYIHPNAKIKGPCFIGRNSRIEDGVEIHPFTVIGENSYIGRYSSIKRSVLWKHSIIGNKVEIRGSILCNNVRVSNNSKIYQGSAIGENSYIHEDVTIKPDVKIWPRKSIEQGILVEDNIIWGTRLRRTFFGKDGIKGYFNTDIDPWFVSRLTMAYGSELKEGTSICVSSNQHNASIMLKHGLITGALSSGLEVIDIGSVVRPITRYAVRYLGLDGGIHISCHVNDPNKVTIHLFDKNGANLSESLERKIENIFISGDFSIKAPIKISKIRNIKDMPTFYIRNLLNSIEKDAIRERKFKILLSTEDNKIASLFSSISNELDCNTTMCTNNISDAILLDNYDFAIRIEAEGESLQLFDPEGKQINNETLISLISLLCFKQDNDIEVVVPYTAPSTIEKMAKTFQSNVIRSKTKRQVIMDEVIKRGDSNQRKSIERFLLYFDGLATVLAIMDLMAKEGLDLKKLLDKIPKTYMSTRDIECPWKEKGRVMRTLIDDANKEKFNIELYEGIKINQDKGWTLILPDSDEPLVKIYSEGISEEYAEELSEFFAHKINTIKEQK